MTPNLRPEQCCVVLVRTSNPLNIGAVARAMVNFGFADLRLVEPFQDAWLGARSAVGAASVLASAREFSTLPAALADCSFILGTASISRRQPCHPVISLPDLGVELPGRLATGRLAIVFGSEKRGLSNHDLSHCSAILQIPTQPVQESMNLGQAVAVCLYELAGRTHPPVPQSPLPTTPSPATSADRERLTQALHRILHRSGYIKPGAARSTRLLIREMLHRLHLSADDSHLILGMLARIKRHLPKGDSDLEV